MSNKLIDFNALSSYKTQSDLKYQDKLTAGDGIGISNGVISVSGLIKTATFTVSSTEASQSITVPYPAPDYILVGITLTNATQSVNLWTFRTDYITGFYMENNVVYFIRKGSNYWAGYTGTLYFLKV